MPSFEFQQARRLATPLEEVVSALKTAIAAADVWVLHEIDPQALLHRGGIEIAPARQILFFHPRYMKRLLDAEPAAVLEAPLKFAVLSDGAEVIVRWYDPRHSFNRYGDPTLRTLGRDLAQLCDGIAAQALGSGQ